MRSHNEFSDTDRPNSVTVRVGDTFRVSCSASSLPPQRPTIRWTRNGRLLPGTFRRVAVPTVSEQLDSGEILETRTLIVSDVVRADAGSYVCTIGRETPLKQTTILSVAGEIIFLLMHLCLFFHCRQTGRRWDGRAFRGYCTC